MYQFIDIIVQSPLFLGIEKSTIIPMLSCLSTRYKHYKKNETILLHGDAVTWVGIVVHGSVQLIHEDIHGNRNILSSCFVPDIFGETFACAEVFFSPISIEAKEDCTIAFIDYKKIITQCSNTCPFHARLIQNMLSIVAKKNMELNQKVAILAQRTTRNKILCFLEHCMQEQNKHISIENRINTCTISYNRQELANLLCVERSAMSTELSKMQSDGLLIVNKKTFTIV